MEELVLQTGAITNVFSKEIKTDIPFISIAARFSHLPGTVCLLSGGDLDCSRYHILALKPWLSFFGSGKTIHIKSKHLSKKVTMNPFDVLRYLLQHYSLKNNNIPSPIQSGLFGYLSYDLKDNIESLPSTTINDLQLPDIYFSAPSIILIEDKKKNSKTIYIPEFENAHTTNIPSLLSWFEDSISKKAYKSFFEGATNGFNSNFTKPAYETAINNIKNYIKSGDIYQVNMSQRFITDFSGDAFSLFQHFYDQNPAPFYAFLNCNNHQIVSTSPERFIKLDGNAIETRPIKGTRPRGINNSEDLKLKKELQTSKKDDAELSMIVDLMRNDIGKVCKSSTVKVKEHKRVEGYQNVFHLISIVEGTLSPNYDCVDLIKATFPGGSITGCPKVRAMEIIDELESNKRHIYTGSIGYISFHQTMDLSIAIRTATIINNKLIFSVGGGIVYDSDPSDEYHETLHKGQTLLNAFSVSSTNTVSKNPVIAWENGLFKKVSEISIPFEDQGFYFGYGFFETLRADNGRVHLLDEHILRLKTAWETFYGTPFPALSFNEIINRLLSENNLNNKTAAIKIITTRGANTNAPYTNKIIITAREYVHRLDVLNKTGLDLITYPKPRYSHIADFKSLNYLYYCEAGDYAKKNNADEAIILNPDGSISETNTANIFLMKERNILIPKSDHYLKGVTQNKMISILQREGYTITEKTIYPHELKNPYQIILSNSLIGATVVKSIDNLSLDISSHYFVNKINTELFNDLRS